ncbi:hypothetical protein HMPREF9098_1191 [Kingella denitrificans ATCC 33394]|uniref:Uncharacterized protein n=2 Tax=Kingella denitrificans TaxID=502 RepID=F0EZA7_9NEIS|nr:hypothetical protein HMPREF9098_1191 [Kingella denitrificans ATCC 33394]
MNRKIPCRLLSAPAGRAAMLPRNHPNDKYRRPISRNAPSKSSLHIAKPRYTAAQKIGILHDSAFPIDQP